MKTVIGRRVAKSPTNSHPPCGARSSISRMRRVERNRDRLLTAGVDAGNAQRRHREVLVVQLHGLDVIGAGGDPVAAVARGPEDLRPVLLQTPPGQVNVLVGAGQVEDVHVAHEARRNMLGYRLSQTRHLAAHPRSPSPRSVLYHINDCLDGDPVQQTDASHGELS
jgi:hypothetical protein